MGVIHHPIESDISITLLLGQNKRISEALLQHFRNNTDFPESAKANVFFRYKHDCPNIASNAANTYSNGLCGYLAYYQYIRTIQTNEFFQCPNLTNKDELCAFKEFYGSIDVMKFTTPYLESKRKKHTNFMIALERWSDGTHDNEYKTSNAVISKENWCSDSLLAEYDKHHLRKGDIHIHASSQLDNESNLFQIFFSRGKSCTQDNRIKASDFKLLTRVPYMTMLHKLHFFLMPNPLFGKDVCNLHTSFANRLRTLIEFYERHSS